MMISPSKYHNLIAQAIGQFWEISTLQFRNRTKTDQGNRSAVTGGKQLDGFISLLSEVALDVGIPIQHIIDIEKTQPFLENVTAYPAIFTISKNIPQTITKYYKVEKLEYLQKELNVYLSNPKTLHISNPDWFSTIPRHSMRFSDFTKKENQDFKIGIGVATGCDKVFIRKDFQNEVEKALLLPLLTSKDVKGDIFKWNGTFLLNPFSPTGKLINLDQYPKAKSSFSRHESQLKKRHVSRKSPSQGYRTIDKINLQLTNQPKIILPDISGNKFIFIDEGKFYPHHNLYYITGPNLTNLKVLAAILLSDFVRNQLAEIGTKMNGGYPRWQSQYLRKLQIPHIHSFPDSLVKQFVKADDQKNIQKINSLMDIKAISSYQKKKGQLTLLDSGNQLHE